MPKLKVRAAQLYGQDHGTRGTQTHRPHRDDWAERRPRRYCSLQDILDEYGLDNPVGIAAWRADGYWGVAVTLEETQQVVAEEAPTEQQPLDFSIVESDDVPPAKAKRIRRYQRTVRKQDLHTGRGRGEHKFSTNHEIRRENNLAKRQRRWCEENEIIENLCEHGIEADGFTPVVEWCQGVDAWHEVDDAFWVFDGSEEYDQDLETTERVNTLGDEGAQVELVWGDDMVGQYLIDLEAELHVSNVTMPPEVLFDLTERHIRSVEVRVDELDVPDDICDIYDMEMYIDN